MDTRSIPFVNGSVMELKAPLKHHRYTLSKLIEDAPPPFATILAHEIRNPLTNIILSVEMLESSITDADLRVYLNIIRRSYVRINNVIGELLKSQQPEIIAIHKYSIRQLLEEVLEIAEDQIILKGIVVKTSFAEENDEVIFNREKIKIAFANIVVNAIDAMEPGKGELSLLTKSIPDGYIVEIEDNGCGISDENLQKISTPYFTNKIGGLGLGLATTYNILHINHIGIKVESREGTGTRFVLTFKKKSENLVVVKPATSKP